jgi:hypothetical protein
MKLVESKNDKIVQDIYLAATVLVVSPALPNVSHSQTALSREQTENRTKNQNQPSNDDGTSHQKGGTARITVGLG